MGTLPGGAKDLRMSAKCVLAARGTLLHCRETFFPAAATGRAFASLRAFGRPTIDLRPHTLSRCADLLGSASQRRDEFHARHQANQALQQRERARPSRQDLLHFRRGRLRSGRPPGAMGNRTASLEAVRRALRRLSPSGMQPLRAVRPEVRQPAAARTSSPQAALVVGLVLGQHLNPLAY